MSPPSAYPDRLVLALDSATEQLAIGVQGRGRAACVNLPGGAAASSTLLPQVHRLLASLGLVLADLDVVAFGAGPGAFTGLRTACAVAQGLGLGLGKPVLPIDSLLIVAEDLRVRWGAPQAATLDVGVLMDARMGEIYAGRYRWSGGRWQVLQAPALLAPDAIAEAWAGPLPDAVAGSALAVFADRLTWPPQVRRQVDQTDRAAALLRLACQAAQAGEGVDAADALPVYLRDKVARTTLERQAQPESGAPQAGVATTEAA